MHRRSRNLCVIAGKSIEAQLAPRRVGFYGANGVSSPRAILPVTRDAFPGCLVALRLERDAEIGSDQHVVIEVDGRRNSLSSRTP
jgi:hypothetical protein